MYTAAAAQPCLLHPSTPPLVLPVQQRPPGAAHLIKRRLSCTCPCCGRLLAAGARLQLLHRTRQRGCCCHGSAAHVSGAGRIVAQRQAGKETCAGSQPQCVPLLRSTCQYTSVCMSGGSPCRLCVCVPPCTPLCCLCNQPCVPTVPVIHQCRPSATKQHHPLLSHGGMQHAT
jgi:hypothetical protein